MLRFTKNAVKFKTKNKKPQDILPRNHFTLLSDQQLSVMQHSLISLLCCVVTPEPFLFMTPPSPPLEGLFQHSQTQCLAGNLPLELKKNPSSTRSSFDKDLGEISLVLHQYHPLPHSGIMGSDCLLRWKRPSEVHQNTREGEKCHGKKGVSCLATLLF